MKRYGFLSFANNVGKSIDKNISKSLSGKYSQKLLNHAQQSATDALKTTSKNSNSKKAEATGYLFDNKIANRITNASKSFQRNNSATLTNEHDKEIPKKRYISSVERQEIIDDLGLI